MVMTFGKYKGKPLDEIPPDYLLWALDNAEKMSPTLREAIKATLRLDSPPAKIAESVRGQLQGVVKSWYRQACRKYHPDHGGSTDKQIVVNDCYESVMKGIEKLEVVS